MTKVKEERLWDDRFIKVLKLLAPGTSLRDGLENVLRGKMGALVVIGNSSSITNLVDGGFNINCEYSPSEFYELAKMDGALILSSDLKRILHAKAQLVPSQEVPTSEAGTRHRTAERMARQTGAMVIAISQRRNIITVYTGTLKYVLKEIPAILSRANQALQTLEKYQMVLNKGLITLSALEFEDLVTLCDVAQVLLRAEKVRRVAGEIERSIIELGSEGKLINMQMEELMHAEDMLNLLIKDYAAQPDNKGLTWVKEQLAALSDDNMELFNVCRCLGYSVMPNAFDILVVPHGYRILEKIPRLPAQVVEKLVAKYKTLPRIYNATIAELDEVEGIGEARAKTIKDGLKTIREQSFLDRNI